MAARLSSTAGRTSLVAAAIVPWNSGTIVGATPSAYPPKGNSKIVSPPTVSGPDAMSYIREILSNEGSGVDISVTTGSGTVAGDLILVFHSNDYNDLVNLTPPTTGSWTLQASGDNGTLSSHVRVWSGTATGGAQTITVQPTVSGEEHALFVVVFNSGSYTVDGAAGNNGSASASQVCPSVTTTGTTDILLTMPTTLGAVGGTYTPPAGTTKRATTNDPTFAFTTSLGTEVLTSAGATGTRTWTFSASIGAWASVSIAVNVGGGGGPATVNGDAALSQNMTLAASALVTELPSAGFSAMSTMVAIPTVKGDASLSQNATLAVNALVTELPAISLIGQAILTAPALKTTLATAAFTFQANQNSSALVTVLGASAESVQAILAIGNLNTVLASSSLSQNANLSATGTLITSGPSAALTGQATLSVSALITELPSATLSQNATLTANGIITRLGSVNLSQNATLAGSSLVSTTGVVALSAILTLTASGTIGALPITVTLSSDSSLSALASLIRMGIVNLNADVTLAANGKASSFAASGLSTTTTLAAIGTIVKLGSVSLSAQSILAVSGFIPVVYNGAAMLSVISILFADGQANPPWVFSLIEFGTIDVSNGMEGSSASNSYEGSSQSAVSIEGG